MHFSTVFGSKFLLLWSGKGVIGSMSGTHIRLEVALTTQEEHVQEAERALADGLQPEDEPVIRQALMGIRAQMVELSDVGLDIVAARRALNVGRHAVFDERFRAKDNDLARLQSEVNERASEGIEFSEALVRKSA